MEVLAGSTDVTTYFKLRLAADGTAATGLTITDLDLQYVRSGATPAAKVDATALAAANSAHGDNQAFEVDGTDQPGLYRVDWPDAAFAASAREVILTVKHTSIFTEELRVNLTPVPVDVRQYAGSTTDVSTMPASLASTLADTNELQTDWTNGGRLDLLLDAALADTNELQGDWVNGGRLDLLLDAALADTNELQTDWVNGGRLDLLLDAVKAKTDSLTFTVSNVLDVNVTYVGGVAYAAVTGTADSGTTTTMVDAARTEADADYWAGSYIMFTSGTISGQTRLITGFTPGTDTITFAPATTQAVSTNTYEIIPAARVIGIQTIDEDTTTLDLDATIRAAVGLASANLDTQLADLPTVAEFEARTLVAANYFDPAADTVANVTTVGSVTTKTGYALTSDYDFAKGTVAMTEAYRATGAAPTPAQAFFELIAHMGNSDIVSTTKTLRKLDTTTAAKTFTLDDDSAPTAIEETT
jgi:hypothetical protein